MLMEFGTLVLLNSLRPGATGLQLEKEMSVQYLSYSPHSGYLNDLCTSLRKESYI